MDIKKSYRLDSRSQIYLPKQDELTPFNYSDGSEVEVYLEQVLKATDDLASNSYSLSEKGKDWPTLYHLSSRRSNLLRPLQRRLSGNILEIGSGCGAITRYLGESAKSVVGIEGSAVRSTLARLRCKDLDNVHIICDNFTNFQTENKFDTVTLIGVLEYSQIYFRTGKAEHPVLSMLKKAKSYLSENGFLVLAIENKLGLKYFSGYPEDHLGVPMYGIEGRYTDSSPITFGKEELNSLLLQAGFSDVLFYYPFPDYKMPISILCDQLTEYQDYIDLSHILNRSELKDLQNADLSTFELSNAWNEVYKNKLWKDLSNSFLVIASNSKFEEENLAYHYSVERPYAYQKETVFTKNKKVVKKLINEGSDRLNARTSSAFSLQLENEDFFYGKNWESELMSIIKTPGWGLQALSRWLETWIKCIKIHLKYEEVKVPLDLKIDGNLLDAVPRNLIIHNESFQFIDLEWKYDGTINFKHLLLRSIFTSIFEQNKIAKPEEGFPYGTNKWNIAKNLLLRAGYWVSESEMKDFFDREMEFLKQVYFNFYDSLPEYTLLNDSFTINEDLNEISGKMKEFEGKLENAINERDLIRSSWSYKIGFYLTHPWQIPGKIIKKIT